MASGLLSAGVGLIGGGIEAYMGYRQKKKLQAQADALQGQRPQWEASPYENSMLQLAESQGGQGISDASRVTMQNENNAGLAGGINAIEKGGGDPNAIGNLYGKYAGGTGQIAMYDDQARQAHLANITTQYARQSANADKAFQFNKYAPWADKMQATNSQLAGATNMMQSGINTALGSLTGGLGMLGGGGSGGSGGGGAQAPQPGMGSGMQGGGGQSQQQPFDNGFGSGGYDNSMSSSAQPYYIPEVPKLPNYQQGDQGSNTWGWNH